MNGNDRFLNVNDAHLRVTGGNVHASSFNLDQISITTTSTTASTIDFLNEKKAFNARSNIEVGTANLFVDTTTSNVGIRTTSPEYALDVHGPANVSVLTANTVTGFDGTLFLGSHLLPTQHQQFDIGSAEKKIRHLFLSDNSLWIGDETKISVVGGKMKFLKRNKNIVPSGTESLGGNATDAKNHAGVSAITDMKLEHWLAYTKSLTGGADKDIKDIFTDATANYEATSASDAFKEHGNDIYSVNKLRLGSAAAADATLDVVGTIKVTQSLTVSDASSTSILGQAAIGWNGASGDTNMASFAQKDNNTGTNFALKQSAGGLTFINAPSNKSIRFQIAGQEKARFDTNGRLGIGTTSPGEKLQIVGDSISMSSGPTSDNYGQLSLTSASNYTGGSYPSQLKFGIDHTVGSFGRGFIQGIVDNTHAGIDLCLCPQGGNVGVGTDEPMTKLDIKCNSDQPSIVFSDSTNSRYQTGIGSFHVANNGQRLDLFCGDSQTNGTLLTNSHVKMSVHPSGGVCIGNTTPYNWKLNVSGGIYGDSLSLGGGGQNIYYHRKLTKVNNGNVSFNFMMRSTCAWTPGFVKLTVASNNSNSSGGYSWTWTYRFMALRCDGIYYFSRSSDMVGSDPGTSKYEQSINSSTGELIITALRDSNDYVVADIEISHYLGFYG